MEHWKIWAAGDGSMSEMFTMARWMVTEGKELEFIDAWSKMAQWSERKFADSVDMKLMRHADKPRVYISLGTWESQESIDQWNSSSEAKELIYRAKRLCEEVDNSLLEPVLEVEDCGEWLEQPIK